MNIIFKIAKTELRNLFYSPVAWFLAIVFLIQCAIFYAGPLVQSANLQELYIKNTSKFKQFPLSLTSALFLGPDGVFTSVLKNLYLFIPLLTMGMLSREINSGTIKLLYSSPIRIREIVLGKYLAIMVFNLILVLIVGIFMLSAAFQIQSVDYGLLLSAALGFYLLICAFAAIGLFMSSLSTYQVVSGIATFMVIFILGRIGTLWQKYDFVRDLTYFLSISGRTLKMLAGLITTKDVIYFLVVIYMFLGFTMFKLKGERESKPWSTKALKYLTVFFSALLIGYVSSRPAFVGYWDTTATQSNTLHPRTQKILKSLDDNSPLEVTLYTNLLGRGIDKGVPEVRNEYLSGLWEPYLRFKPNIQFKYVYYYDPGLDSNLYKFFPGKTLKQIAGITARTKEIDSAMFMPPADIRKMIDPVSENNRLFMQLNYKGKKVNLRTFDDPLFWPTQTQVADGLKRLAGIKTPKVHVLSGNLERSIYKKGEREYSGFSIEKLYRESLINHGFDIDTLSLENRDIPVDITCLIIADPKTDLTAITLNKVRKYIDDGGNLLVMGEPKKQAVLNPLLAPLGIQLMKGTLIELSKNEAPDKILPMLIAADTVLAEEPGLLILKEIIKTKNTDDTLKIDMPGATALSYGHNSMFKITPLLTTVPRKSWLKAGALVTDSVAPVFSPNEGDIKEPSFVTAVSLTRQIKGKEQRIIVCSDADFTSNLRLRGNLFGNGLHAWLNYNTYPQYLPQSILAKDVLLTISGSTARTLKIIYIWVLPGLLLIAGTLLLIRRKRK